MGAISFIKTITAEDINAGFNTLVEDAIYEKGHDPYGGGINTCDLGRKRMVFEKYNKTNENKGIKFADENISSVGKRVADYIDLGVVHYVVTTYKKEHTGNSPKYKMKFTVKSGWRFDAKAIKSFNTKKEADDHAIIIAKRSKEDIFVEKEYVLVEGEATTTRIIKEKKIYKSKPKLKSLPNRTIKPIHKYILFGWAAW